MIKLLVRCSPVLLAVPVAAQAPVRLDDMQVTASRVPAPAASLPAAVTILQGDDLRARGISYLLDALGDVPSATVAQAGSYGAQASLFLRGGESDHVKVLVDGVTMNDPGGLFDLGSLSLEDVDRVEIVRGPVSVLYGADAMAGVVQVFTRDGADTWQGELEARGGSHGGRDLRGGVRGGSGAWQGSAAASRFASDGIYAFNNGFEDLNATIRASVGGGERGRVRLAATWSDATNHFPTDGNGALVDRNQRNRTRDLALSVAAVRPLGATAELAVDAWSHRLVTAARDEQDEPADTTGFAFAGTRDGTLARRGVGVRGEWSASGRLRLSGGLGLEHEAEDQHGVTASNFGFGTSVDSAVFRADRTTRHAWAQLLAGVGSSVSAQAGVRVDDNDAFGTFATARGGVSWQLAAPVRVWGAAGTGFKAPTFSELFAASPFEVGNPALDPERSTSLEAGLEVQGGAAVVSLVAFRQEMRDLIQYVSAAPGEPTYANLQAATSRGVEVSVRVAPHRRVGVRAHFTLLDTEVSDTGASSSVVFTQGEPLLRRPAARAGVTVTARPGKVRLALTATWVGERHDADFRDFPATRMTLPSYGTLDAAAELPLGGLTGVPATLLGRVENLLDEEYQQVLGFRARGRTLFAGARLTF